MFMNSGDVPLGAAERTARGERAAATARRAGLWRGLSALAVACLASAGPALAQQAQGQSPAPAAPPPVREWRTPPPGDVARGAVLYQQQCVACHAIDAHRTGPAHRGVMGRRVGSQPGYRYSAEVAQSRFRWTPQTLNLWLEDPEALVPGQRMGYQVEDLQERADLIAFLASLK